MLKLLEKADVLLDPFRPGVRLIFDSGSGCPSSTPTPHILMACPLELFFQVLERIGLGPEVVMAHNPKLIYARLTGFGQTGPSLTPLLPSVPLLLIIHPILQGRWRRRLDMTSITSHSQELSRR